MDKHYSSSSSFLFLHHHRLLHAIITVKLLLLVVFPCVIALNISSSSIQFHKGFTPLFGETNIIRSEDDRSLQIHLNQFTGSGFKSSELYSHGFFSAKIKLPADYTAGVVVAFYTTNGDIFKKSHDELDFEFLGNVKGKSWRFQTNMYGNGSTNRGREERYYLWFDPSKEFHRYSILWTPQRIVFYIDNIPIREMTRHDEMGADFPSKPMGLYATIWDGSDWATSGGKYRANYKYAPFVAEFTDLVLLGCTSDPLEEVIDVGCEEKDAQIYSPPFDRITYKQRQAMKSFRSKYVYYSYCYDTVRYPVAPPECVIDPAEQRRYKETGRLKLDRINRRSYKKNADFVKVKSYEIGEDE